MLYAGSKIFQTNDPVGGGRVCAVVTETGAETVKGRLVKDILYPTPIVFVFLEHLKIVFTVLGVWGIGVLFINMWIIGGDSINSWFYGAFVCQSFNRSGCR
jgi:magnesium-transporting ATPase (P-type)